MIPMVTSDKVNSGAEMGWRVWLYIITHNYSQNHFIDHLFYIAQKHRILLQNYKLHIGAISLHPDNKSRLGNEKNTFWWKW